MNDKQLLLKQVKENIKKNINETPIRFYNSVFNKYENIEEYLEPLTDIIDKITIAQWANDKTVIEKLIKQIHLGENEQKKYNELLSKNRDINRTINFDILNEKYDFLNPILDIVTTNVSLQHRITSLSNERLELFKVLCEHLYDVSNYPIPYISEILDSISYSPFENDSIERHRYEELTVSLENSIKDGHHLNEKDIESIIFLYNTDIIGLPIHDLWDIRDINNIFKKDYEKDLAPQRNSENPDIHRIKFTLLGVTYGISDYQAERIVSRLDFSRIKITEENKDLIEVYTSIAKIVTETDAKKLLQIYDDYCAQNEIDLDFMKATLLTENLKKVFAREVTKSTFKAEGQPNEVIDNIPVYDAGTDFKMLVTAIGAFQKDFTNKENYNEYWNSSIIQTHTSSCSVIANNNLLMATIRNVIFGFSSMEDTMLMNCSNKDLGSSDFSKDLYVSIQERSRFMAPDELIDNTRGDYNELVYERRDLEKGAKNFKKNPDYIVFIEEYEDNNTWLEKYKDQPNRLKYLQNQLNEQKQRWEETIKAAKDFNIPIVKINREKCAKNEIEKIHATFNEFQSTLNPNLISDIITQYENNSVGLCSPHEPLKSLYFSNKRMNFILNEIEKTILSADAQMQPQLLNAYKSALEEEYKKVEDARGYRNNNQSSGINYRQRFAFINQALQGDLEQITNIDQEQTVSSKQRK